MENWTEARLKEQIWYNRILCWWVLLVYFFPTVFAIMAGIAVWQLIAWGLTASAFALWFYEDTYKEVNAILTSRRTT